MKLLYITITETFFRQIKPVILALGDDVKEVHVRVESLDCKERDEQWAGPVHIRNYAAPILKGLAASRNISSYFHWIGQKNQEWDFLQRYLMHHSATVTFMCKLLHRLHLTRLLPARFLTRAAKNYDARHEAPTAILEDVRNTSPDVAIICPLLYPNSMEADYAKACRRLGVPVVVIIASWDNLTSKNTFPVEPDYVFVWNSMQAKQLIRFHQIPESKIIITGAQLFDYMFDQSILVNRKRFCETINLDVKRRFVLWAASSRAADADEPGLLKEMLKKIREHEKLSDLQVLIRPYPKYQEQWNGWCEPDTYVWGKSRFPNDAESCEEIRDSLHYAFAVIGLSSSIFFEAAIADCPCAIVDQSEESGRCKQLGYTKFIHYQFLKSGEVFKVVPTIDACVEWLDRLTAGIDEYREERQIFLKKFIRPHGLKKSAARCAADALVKIAYEKRKISTY